MSVKTYSPEELKQILALHKKWLDLDPAGQRANLQRANLEGAHLGGANLQRANLEGANLQRANLQRAYLEDANLQRAYLEGANLEGANLEGANLQRANLQRANLEGAHLEGAHLGGANLPYGETWEVYLAEVVPALLKAGGRDVTDILKEGAWDCHSWQNCPMACAFGVHDAKAAPLLLRPRIDEFVRFFDARLIPPPKT